jgi:hypothetical protein
MRRKKTQISKIRNAKRAIATNNKEIIKDYLKIYIPINLKILKKWTNF